MQVADEAGGMQAETPADKTPGALSHFGWNRMHDLAADLGGEITYTPLGQGILCRAVIPLGKITLKSYDKTTGT
jgi:hypothetical protein